jgi:hypothetical protein
MGIDAASRERRIDEVSPMGARPSRRLAVFGLVGLFAVFLASALFRPPAGDYFTICGFKNFTGLPCPGCGLTHSFCALGKGEVFGAFAFNFLGPPLFFVLILLWIRSACVLLNRSDVVRLLDRIAGRFSVARTFAIGFVVYGVARIAYLVVYDPASFSNSPLSQLIVRLVH